MLAYLDRAPAQLPLEPRVTLAALRLWARAVRQDGCPVGVLRDVLGRFNAQRALWPLHNFFYWVLAHPARPVELGCPCLGRVSDDEALLLSSVFAPGRDAARAALTDLVSPSALSGAVRLARSVDAELTLALAARAGDDD